MFLAFIVWLVMTVIPVLNTVSALLIFSLCTTFVGSVMCALMSDLEELRPWNFWKKSAKWLIPVCLVLALVPDTKTSWYMVGAYATQTVAQSDAVKEIGSDGVDLMKDLIKQARKEIGELDIKKEIKEAVAPEKEEKK